MDAAQVEMWNSICKWMPTVIVVVGIALFCWIRWDNDN